MANKSSGRSSNAPVRFMSLSSTKLMLFDQLRYGDLPYIPLQCCHMQGSGLDLLSFSIPACILELFDVFLFLFLFFLSFEEVGVLFFGFMIIVYRNISLVNNGCCLLPLLSYKGQDISLGL